MYINSTLKDKSTWDRQLSLRSSQVHWVSTHWGLTWAQVGPGSHYCQSNQVCKVSMIVDLWRPLGWTTTVTDRQTATSFNQPPPSWCLVRLGSGESWKLIGWCFGAPWAATGSLLRQFESRSTSAERKQDCWTTNNKQTNSIYSLTVQCWYLISCPVYLSV